MKSAGFNSDDSNRVCHFDDVSNQIEKDVSNQRHKGKQSMGRGLELIARRFLDSQHFTAMGLPHRGKQDSIDSKLFFELDWDVLSSGGDNDPVVRRMLKITEFAVPAKDGDIGDSGFSEVSSSQNGQFIMTFNGHHLFCQQAQQSSVVSAAGTDFKNRVCGFDLQQLEHQHHGGGL